MMGTEGRGLTGRGSKLRVSRAAGLGTGTINIKLVKGDTNKLLEILETEPNIRLPNDCPQGLGQ